MTNTRFIRQQAGLMAAMLWPTAMPPLGAMPTRGPVFAPPNDTPAGGDEGESADSAFSYPGGSDYTGEEDSGGNLEELYSAFGVNDGEEDDEGEGGGEGEGEGLRPGQQRPGSGQDQNQGQDPRTAAQQAEIQRLHSSIAQTIQSAAIPDNLIPADFDPNDRQQFRTVLGSAMQQSLTIGIQLAARVMQPALEHARREMEQHVQQSITTTMNRSGAEAQLLSLVPALTNPKNAAILTPMRKALEAEGRNTQAIAKALNVVAKQLGLTAASGAQRGTGGGAGGRAGQTPGGRTTRFGPDALNDLFQGN